ISETLKRRRENIPQLFRNRLNRIRHFVKYGNDAAKKRWGCGKRRCKQRLTKTPHRRTNILQRTNRSAAKLFRDRTSRFGHRLFKLGKPNLASRSHLKDFIRSHTKLVSQSLINRQTTIRDLRQNIILRLTDRRNLVKDSAHLIHAGTGSRSVVSDRLENILKLTPRLNTSSDSTSRRSSSLAKAEGRTLNRSQGIIHNRVNVFSVIAKTLQLRLRSLNASKTAKALSDRTRERTTGSNTNASNTSFK